MRLSRFNEQGVEKFRQILAEYREGAIDNRIAEILESPPQTDSLALEFDLHEKVLDTRLLLAKNIDALFTNLRVNNLMLDTGLWAWLSAALFDTVCPINPNTGLRTPGADYRHIPSESFRHFYRHLIRGPVRTLTLFKGNENAARIIFCQRPDRPGDFIEQLASRQERVTSQAVIETASILFYDEEKKSPKRGVSPNEAKPGTLRRYLNVLDQLELTYDLYSIHAEELASLLPNDLVRH